MVLTRNRAYQSPLSVNDQDIDVSEDEYDRQSKENMQRWVKAHIISFPFSPPLPQTSPLDFPSDSDPKKMTTYDALSEGKSVPFVYEKNEVEIQDGESRIRILNSKTVRVHTVFDFDQLVDS
ncbi:hypothetical protein GYMLUDRAFT_248223 [Collybiopsis luxurians FD-317 M1]|uniref:FAS1 domain-containing protein n=1 Tax=Collybiopsis luxurians FD-317 M1 TaxID=944289 RepID=A0A0D0AZ62_9AGAR|nr:hypothetical protein GYMLUDRAFT_248223 [Collybiopsis luxurians FD-317 M1]